MQSTEHKIDKYALTDEELAEAERIAANPESFNVAVIKILMRRGKMAEDFKRIFNGKRYSKRK